MRRTTPTPQSRSGTLLSMLSLLGACAHAGTPHATAPVDPARVTAANREVDDGLRRFQCEVVGEGCPDDAEWVGCSGAGATWCVQRAWITLATTFVRFADVRCGDAPDVVAARSAFERARAEADARTEVYASALSRDAAGQPEWADEVGRRESEAEASVAQATARAAAVLRGCEHRDDRLTEVATWLSGRDTQAIPPWAPMR